MDRAALLASLETANRHVSDGQRHIERQREIVARLEQRGRGASHTAKVARELLASMQRIQRSHVGHRSQIKAELARVDEPALSTLTSIGAERWRDAHIEGQERS
jgi:hypothetical protein